MPEDPAKRDAALLRLKGRRAMSVRLNRLFQADGEAGIRKFKRMARHYARLGFDVELQVRYHPAPAQNGDIGAWLDYVRRVVRAFGPIRRVVAPADHQRGQPDLLAQHLRWRLPQRRAGAGAGRPGREARSRGGSATAG